eukprot:c16942_g1_i1 orf=1-1053(-)
MPIQTCIEHFHGLRLLCLRFQIGHFSSLDGLAQVCVVPVGMEVRGNGELRRHRARDRDDIIKDYELKLHKVRRAAYVTAGLQSITHFLALCNLTWATVVLLGGFVSTLASWDFYVVSCLLLIDAGRYSTTLFFSKMVTKGSQNPEKLRLMDFQPSLADLIRIIALVGQVIFVLPSFFLPIIRLKSGGFQRSLESPQPNLDISLRVFYSLFLINAVTASVAILYSLFHTSSRDKTIQDYYDEVLQRALDKGILEANNFDFFEFAFRVWIHDYSRNVHRKVVCEVRKNLIEYLHAHRKGVEAVGLLLESDDTYSQQAAASIVGIWAGDSDIDPNQLPKSLFTKLADKLGTGQT